MCTPIIFGRPFLATAGCHIDVTNGKLSFHVGDDHVEFNLFKASKIPSISDECHRNNVMDLMVREEVNNHVSSDPLEHYMLNADTFKDENPKGIMCAQFLEASSQFLLTLAN